MLITTPASSSANAYGDLTEADAYFATRLGSAVWTALANDDAKREQSAITATRELDTMFPYLPGSISVSTQRLRWPRTGVVDADGRDVDPMMIPELLKEAQFELQLALLSAGASGGADAQLELIQRIRSAGISSGKIGPLEFKFESSSSSSSTYSGGSIPEAVASKLRLLFMFAPTPRSHSELFVIRC